MAEIKREVRDEHLRLFPEERDIIESFVQSHSISWARSRVAHNTKLSCYILNPEKHIRDTFGFTTEIALFIPKFPQIQPRTYQAIFQFINENPMRGRVDKSIFYILVPQGDSKKNAGSLYDSNHYSSIPIFFEKSDLIKAKSDSWHLRNLIASEIFTRDLFDFQLPLKDDSGFFGRDSFVFDFSEAISRGQNRGLFGLRKTGKTSLIFKIQRNLSNKDSIISIYYDCKKPSIRNLSAVELIDDISDRISSAVGSKIGRRKDENAYGRIDRVVREISEKKKICIIFDEVEYISFLSPTNQHWKKQYLDFWQTMWSIQSETSKICFIISGVNAQIVEQDLIDGIQNPLFGIVPRVYLQGLSIDETRRMINYFGKRMGLNFSADCINILQLRYGGHPLLTRKACSYINTMHEGERRPIQVDSDFVTKHFIEIDDEIQFYFKHVLSELEMFYKMEFEILEMICAGQRGDAKDLINYGQIVDHLVSYGLIKLKAGNIPQVTIECLKEYLSRVTARKEGRRVIYREISGSESGVWLRNRLKIIVKELRKLSKICERDLKFYIFQGHEICEAENFFEICDVSSRSEFESFLVCASKSLIECIEYAGKKQRKEKFMFGTIKNEFPELFGAIQRIRVYRHYVCHLELKDDVRINFQEYIKGDFLDDSFDFSSVNDMRVAQQYVLNELLLAIQSELATRQS